MKEVVAVSNDKLPQRVGSHNYSKGYSCLAWWTYHYLLNI